MADIIGQETWSAGGKSYVIKVTEPGATVTENAISIISGVVLRRGQEDYGPLEPILESELRFTIRDTGKLFSNAISGKQVGDIVLEFTEDAVTIFKGYVVPEYQRSLAYQSNPEFTVSAFDGISGLKGFTYDQGGEQTVREQLYNISNKIGLSLQLNSIFDWEHVGADSGTDDVDKLHICVEQLLTNEGATYYDVLTLLCRFYCAQFFQSAGEWYFMQRHLRGATVTNYPTNSAGSSLTDETSNFVYTATNDLLHRSSSYFSLYPAHSRIVSKHTYPNYLINNPDWSEGNKYWDNNNQDEASGSRRRITGNGGYLRQTIGTTFLRMSTGSDDRLGIDLGVHLKIASGATGTHDVDYLKVTAKLPDGNKYYLTSASAWSTMEQHVSESVDMGTFSDSVRTFPGTSFTTPQMPDDPIQITIELFFDKDASGNAADLEYIEFDAVQITHFKPDPADDEFRATELVVTEQTDKLGNTLEEEFAIGDTDDNTFYGVGVFEYYDGTDWLPTQIWTPSSLTAHRKRAIELKDQLDERLKTLEVSHKFGEEIDLHNTVAYDDNSSGVGDIYVPTFVEKTYGRNAKVYTRSAGKQLLDASAVVNVTPNNVYYARRFSIRKAPISSTTPWTSSEITTIDSGREYYQIDVDEAAGYIFTVERDTTTPDNRWIVRRDLDGSNKTDIVSYTTAGGTGIEDISLGRVNSYIYAGVATYPGLYTGHTIKRYEYDGTLVDTLVTNTDGAIKGVSVDQTETYVHYRENRVGTPSYDRFRRVTIATTTDDILLTSLPSLSINNGDTVETDEDAGYIFYRTSGEIGRIIYHDAASTTLVASVAHTDYGVALDRANQKFYFTKVNGTIHRRNYDDTGDEDVVINGADATIDLSLGF